MPSFWVLRFVSYVLCVLYVLYVLFKPRLPSGTRFQVGLIGPIGPISWHIPHVAETHTILCAPGTMSHPAHGIKCRTTALVDACGRPSWTTIDRNHPEYFRVTDQVRVGHEAAQNLRARAWLPTSKAAAESLVTRSSAWILKAADSRSRRRAQRRGSERWGRT